jgi:6-phospho-beta-glucosidase
MKVAVIGGGSTYTPELVEGFISRADQFPLTELWLMDIDSARLEIVGGFARRMVAARGSPFKVVLTTDQRKAIEGASYVTTQFRVGQMEARRRDEYLGRRHGLIGQETTGVGGMAKALRTIPVILKIADDMRSLAPGALLVNFTNPSGLVTQALSIHASDVPAVGVCNSALTTKMGIIDQLQMATGKTVDPGSTQLNALGLNHLTWYRGFTVDGEDVWSQVLAGYLESLKTDPDPEWDPHTIEVLRMIPNSYLQYYYATDKKLAAQQKWPPSRAEEVIEIEKSLLARYADPVLQQPPPELMMRGGAYYSTVATQLLNSHYNDLNEIHIVNTRNNGAVAGWPDSWVLELPAGISRKGILPLPADPLPPVCFGLLAQIKSFELLTIDAAVHGDRNAAYQALLAHPLGPKADKIPEVLEDLLETNKSFLPQFWK